MSNHEVPATAEGLPNNQPDDDAADTELLATAVNEFEPWDGVVELVSPEAWASWLSAFRTCQLTMHRTKDELAGFFDTEEDAAFATFERAMEFSKFLEDMKALADAASARLMISAAYAATREAAKYEESSVTQTPAEPEPVGATPEAQTAPGFLGFPAAYQRLEGRIQRVQNFATTLVALNDLVFPNHDPRHLHGVDVVALTCLADEIKVAIDELDEAWTEQWNASPDDVPVARVCGRVPVVGEVR